MAAVPALPSLWLVVLLVCLSIRIVSATYSDKRMPGHHCPNNCGSGGVCVGKEGYSPNGVCACFPGFYGYDCSLRLCPAGNAWVDFPSANNVAHGASTECSNMGVCDRNSGNCKCRPGFGGPACELLMCPLGTSIRNQAEQCSGHGSCLTLREMGTLVDYSRFYEGDALPYSADAWDADMLRSCACHPGWEGLACDQRSCPKGNDPDANGVDDVQLLECTCSTCTGGLRLSFRGDQTLAIPLDASDDLVKLRLEQLSSVERADVTVTFGANMCSSSGSLTAIKIRLPQGPASALSLETYGGLAGTISIRTDGQWSMVDPRQVSVKGTKNYVECSNRGQCDYGSGQCRCVPGFESSDGLGGRGRRGDCGHRYESNVKFVHREALYDTSADAIPQVYAAPFAAEGTVGFTNCPVVPNVGICSNHGRCEPGVSTNTNSCKCDTGWTGILCNRKTCPVSSMWVGKVGAAHVKKARCAGIGTCNEATGVCEQCGGGYGAMFGDSCQFLSCPSGGAGGEQCSDRGYCRSMRDLAGLAWTEQKQPAAFTYTSQWDADRIYGCACMRSPSVDNVFHRDYSLYLTQYATAQSTDSDPRRHDAEYFYRGPYAFSVTDYWGFNCALARCPSSDNPATRMDTNEFQVLRCIATSGSFRMTFRGNTTMPVAFDTKATVFAYRLEQLYTLHQVNVYYYQADMVTPAASDKFCTAAGTTYVVVEFVSEFGDLPLLQWQNVDLLNSGGSVTFTVADYITGTKEDVECSGQGTCNEYTGICDCRTGFGSSNSTIYGSGDRGDCTFRNRFNV